MNRISAYLARGFKAFSAAWGWFLLGGLLCYLPFLVYQYYFPLAGGEGWVQLMPLRYWELFITAGLSLGALKVLRGGKPGSDELFAGFRHLGDLAGYWIVLFLLNPESLRWVSRHYPPGWPDKNAVLLAGIGVFILFYVSLMFTLYLLTDKRLSWLQAMGRSWGLIIPRWFTLLLLFALCFAPYFLAGWCFKLQRLDMSGMTVTVISNLLKMLVQPLKVCIVGAAFLEMTGEAAGEFLPKQA